MIVFAFAEGLTKNFVQKNNLPNEEIAKNAVLFIALKHYRTSLTLGIPKNKFVSNALSQFWKEFDTFLDIFSLYINNRTTVINEVAQSQKDYYIITDTVNELLIF